jgi:hypothetical protein
MQLVEKISAINEALLSAAKEAGYDEEFLSSIERLQETGNDTRKLLNTRYHELVFGNFDSLPMEERIAFLNRKVGPAGH